MTDDNLTKWLEAKFDGLSAQIEKITEQLSRLEDRHHKCRDHCDAVSSRHSALISELKANQAAHIAEFQGEKGFTHRLAGLEDRAVQSDQSYWMKLAGLATLISAAAAIFAHFLHKAP